MKLQKKDTSKAKVLFVVVAVFMLAGAFLLQKLYLKKYFGHEKSLSSNHKIHVATDNTDLVNDGNSKARSVKHVEQTLPQTPSPPIIEEKLVLEDSVSDVELPSPVDENRINRVIARAQLNQIWRSQDKVRNRWPDYLNVRGKLLKELQAELEVKELSNEQLIQTALGFRNRFWKAGGCLSETSYLDAYKARILLELAHERNPENMEIVDQFVETIQAANPFVVFSKETGKLVRNKEIEKTLLELRSKQFEQSKKEIHNGRNPIWEDFVCACDLSILLSGRDNNAAKEVIEWQRAQADGGDWTGYMEVLDIFLSRLNQGRPYNYDIYIDKKRKFPEDYRYSRRLPSFRGPEERNVQRWDQVDNISIVTDIDDS